VSVLSFPSNVSSGGVAYSAHIGGFVAGMAVAFLLPGERHASKETVDLSELATTDELREMQVRIDAETEPDVRRAWLESFVKKAQCPSCGSRPVLEGNRIKCACGWEKRVR